VARKAHYGFGMKILFYVPSEPDSAIVEALQAVRCQSVDELLSEAHFVSVHCPGGAATRHLINEQRLQLMRPSAHLINTARGDVIDSNALIKALKAGWIAGAGLDVYEGEPHIHPEFLSLDNITLLPHIGSASEETRIAMGERVVSNLVAYFDGHEPADRVV
jgi:lactate dehydrogenase-like 2-hydroxyacid dehydrogenase